ncbi:MAG: AAA family ATPase, partial [Bacteroidales bacterium]|nr:AAA family ATPase [Bacteroidales bacterium]
MKSSIFFYKELTPAEVGHTNTHETYIRFPNTFDYDEFFNHNPKTQGTVIECTVDFLNLTPGVNKGKVIPLRFVYYVNSASHEKRIPSLGNLFRDNNVEEGDVVCIERREEKGKSNYYITFYKKGEITIFPQSFYFSKKYGEDMLIENGMLETLQTIFYGAPGTGKSYRANGMVLAAKQAQANPDEENCVRTTFHPDSDYSTFVGAYKPTMRESERISDSGHAVTKHGTSEIVMENRIEYSFIPQAFLKAYVGAWKRWARNPEAPEPYFLVIEEINRGNCAQIFGDLFQLLDRDDNGESSYEVNPDKDIAKFLKYDVEGFKNEDSIAVPDKIRNGETIKLPSNLYILATMNTSDQSLFPIDSAFKRRWDWQYEPIAEGKNADGTPMGWKIEFTEGEPVDWWEFVQAINEVIENKIHSEDKKLGYFFCRARNGKISAKMFLSKVIFYLWNDVFRGLMRKSPWLTLSQRSWRS